MQRSFKRLERVLDLEKKQGYQNKAVVGGIRQFVTYWISQAQEEAVDEADRAFVEQTAELLSDYGRLPGVEARQKAIAELMNSLKTRESRVQELFPEAPPPDPPPARVAPRPVSEKRSTPAKPKPVKQAPPPLSTPEPAELPDVDPDPDGLAQSVMALKGVGAKFAKRFSRLGVETIIDLLYLFPRRYDDYTRMKSIDQLVYGETVTIIGTIWETRARRTRTNQVMVQSIITDGTGRIQATWFNQPWLVDKLKAGMQIVLSGTVDQYLGRLVFQSPEWEALEWEPLRTRRIVPVYPLTEGLNGNKNAGFDENGRD